MLNQYCINVDLTSTRLIDVNSVLIKLLVYKCGNFRDTFYKQSGTTFVTSRLLHWITKLVQKGTSLSVFMRFSALYTLKCLSIGTPKTINFPFVPNEKLMVLGVSIFEHIKIRL